MAIKNERIDLSDSEGVRKLTEEIGAEQIDRSILSSIELIWMTLPPSERNVDALRDAVRERYQQAMESFDVDRFKEIFHGS